MRHKPSSRGGVDSADIAELMSCLNELTFADTYNGFTTLKWIRRRPYAAIDRLNSTLERTKDASEKRPSGARPRG